MTKRGRGMERKKGRRKGKEGREEEVVREGRGGGEFKREGEEEEERKRWKG